MPQRFFCLILGRRFFLALVLLLLVGSSLFWYALLEPVAFYTMSTLTRKVSYDIMLDPGHGGIDGGGTHGGILEKDINLAIALQMQQLLTQEGWKVGLTRTDDSDLSHLETEGTRHKRDLLARFKKMNEAHLGMSIHSNIADDPKMQGAIVFYRKDSYSGRLYAQTVLDELARVQVLDHDFPVPRSNLWLLKSKNPVVMVEVGFLSNSSDREKLILPEFQREVAKALVQGILQFAKHHPLERTE